MSATNAAELYRRLLTNHPDHTPDALTATLHDAISSDDETLIRLLAGLAGTISSLLETINETTGEDLAPEWIAQMSDVLEDVD